jgi:hypothetical protein
MSQKEGRYHFGNLGNRNGTPHLTARPQEASLPDEHLGWNQRGEGYRLKDHIGELLRADCACLHAVDSDCLQQPVGTDNQKPRPTDSNLSNIVQIVRGESMRRPQPVIAAMAEEAKDLDKKLRQKIGAVKELTLEVGGILKQMREKELHKYIRKPGSRKGYVHFDDYASEVTGMSGSSVWMAMKIFRLTEGVNPVTPLDVRKCQP